MKILEPTVEVIKQFIERCAIDAYPDAQYIANKLRTIIYE